MPHGLGVYASLPIPLRPLKRLEAAVHVVGARRGTLVRDARPAQRLRDVEVDKLLVQEAVVVGARREHDRLVPKRAREGCELRVPAQA